MAVSFNFAPLKLAPGPVLLNLVRANDMVDGRYQPFETGPDATIEAQSVFARVKKGGGEMEEPSQAKEGHHNSFAQSSASFFLNTSGCALVCCFCICLVFQFLEGRHTNRVHHKGYGRPAPIVPISDIIWGR